MKNITLFTDAFFIAFIIFIVSFLTLNYFVPRPYSILIAVFICIPITLFSFKHLKEKNKKSIINSVREKETINTINSLSLMKKTELINFFQNAFEKKGLSPTKKYGGLYLKNLNTYYFFKFDFSPLKKSDIVKYFNYLEKNQKAEIFTDVIDSEVLEFASRFNGKITVLDKVKTYEFLSKINTLPEVKFELTDKKVKASIKNIFIKKHAKKFFLFGALFLLLSFFVPIKVYYVVCGTLLMLLALFSILFGKTNA